MTAFAFAIASPQEFETSSGVYFRTVVTKPSTLNALEAYLTLKSLFGEPNRDLLDDTKQQWAFLLKTDGALVEAYDWKLDSWSIGVRDSSGNALRAESIAKDLLEQLVKASSRTRAAAQSLLRAPTGHVIENPFALYYGTASDLIDLVQRPLVLGQDSSLAAPGRDWASESPLCRAAFFQLIAAFEGFLNIIYEIYLSPELRDDRIVDRLGREQIDIKLRLAPVYCDCFQDQPIDHRTAAFRTFHTLANYRNDFIHANLTKNMRTPVVTCDGMSFVVPQETDPLRLVPPSLCAIDLESLLRVKDAIDAIVSEVMSQMTPRARREFESVMHDEYISVEYDNGVPIILATGG